MDYIRHYGTPTLSQQSTQSNEFHSMTDTSSSHVIPFNPTNLEKEALNKWKIDSLHHVLSYHRKIAKKEQQVKKLAETTSKGHLTMDSACLSLRPYQWPKSMSAEVTQHLDHTHSEAITNIVKSIQSDRLKMLVKDLSDFKVEYSEENLIIYCKETLKTICPNVIQHEDIVDRLTEGLSRDILQSEINRSTKPPPTPAPPISSNPLESHHDFLDEMREMRAEIKALQAQIGKTKTPTNKSNPRKPSPTPGKDPRIL